MSNEPFALVRRWNGQGFSVLGNGSTGHPDALPAQQAGDFAVAQRLVRLLGLDQFLDQGADRRGRASAAMLCVDMAGEKAFQFKQAPGRVHVFAGGDARDGGFVQVQTLGDIAQHQRLHGFLAVFQEGSLSFDDATGDAQQRFAATLQTLDEPSGLLQMIFQRDIVGAAVGAADHVGVARVDAQPRQRIRVELHLPGAVRLFHEHIWRDIFRRGLLRLVAGARIQRLH